MHEPFTIAVNNEDYKARFERYGYTHRIIVLIGDETVVFEPDEEGGYRVLGSKLIDYNLLKSIAEKLVALSR